MKKKSKAKAKAKQAGAENIRFEPKDKSKRNFLTTLRNYAIGFAIVGSAGGVWAYSIQGSLHEQDLTRIGQGVPSIVQVHNPQCSLCRSLQRETRAALEEFGDDELTYLVADINTAGGRDIADKYSVPHVTLLLFDGAGELQHIVRGVQQKETLVAEFQDLLKRSS